MPFRRSIDSTIGDEIITEGRVSDDAREVTLGSATRSSYCGSSRDGKLIRLEQLGAGPQFPDALEAAGLRESAPLPYPRDTARAMSQEKRRRSSVRASRLSSAEKLDALLDLFTDAVTHLPRRPGSTTYDGRARFLEATSRLDGGLSEWRVLPQSSSTWVRGVLTQSARWHKEKQRFRVEEDFSFLLRSPAPKSRSSASIADKQQLPRSHRLKIGDVVAIQQNIHLTTAFTITHRQGRLSRRLLLRLANTLARTNELRRHKCCSPPTTRSSASSGPSSVSRLRVCSDSDLPSSRTSSAAKTSQAEESGTVFTIVSTS